uniref:Melanotransferrin 2 n=1 Tax=Holothuria glaberrima TaxID=31192 RepID=A0A0K1Z5K0_HOLGL|nr:melanotransferrin 2 [Holothuria glaberrima]
MLLCVLLLCFAASWVTGNPAQAPVARWCTISSLEQVKCQNMSLSLKSRSLIPEIECVQKSSPVDCMKEIRDGRADLITLDGGDIYMAGKVFGMKPIMEETYSNNIRGYHGIAVVKADNPDININNLEGRKSCHTGYGRTAGWNIPVGYLLGAGHMESAGCQSSMLSAAKFFNESCAPGVRQSVPWYINEDDVDNLCAACHDNCERSGTERYNGYNGAFRCLVEGAGDVAFVKPATIYGNTNNPNGFPWAQSLQRSDFELLCQDGTRAPVEEYTTCHLAQSPPHGVMTSGSKSQAETLQYQNLLTSAQDVFGSDTNTEPENFHMFASSAYGGSNLLFKDSAVSLSNSAGTYQAFLGSDYVQSVEGLHKCPEGTIRFCIISEQELRKCEAMKKAFDKAGLTPSISCFQTQSYADCSRYIKGGYADLVALDGGDIYSAGSEDGLIPILGEDYGAGDASYWAVAVVKRDSNFGINDLEGKKSCHTGIMKTSGWIVPIGLLIKNGVITVNEDCDVPEAVGDFFEQSCVPGAKSSKYDPDGTNPSSLCDLCVGENEDNCVRNTHEPYYGYTGALRCLAEGAGDVAFVKHTTVSDNVNGPEEWNSSLNKGDYQLLCADGTRAEIDNYNSCHLAKVPSHALMTAGDQTEDKINEMVDLFLAAKNLFANDDDSGNFKLFDSAGYTDSEGNSGKDLLFKDSTVNFLEVDHDERNYQSWLGQEYLNAVKGIRCL